MAVTKSITGWRLDVSLQRPLGELWRQFRDDTFEWNAFKGALQRIVGDRFELALTNGTSVLDLAAGAWPMELEINHSKISFNVLAPHLSPLDLATSEVKFIHRGDFRPAKLRMTSTDPRIAMDQEVAPTWREIVWRKITDPEAEPHPLYQYESAPRRVKTIITEQE
jgi:hypothetical protein